MKILSMTATFGKLQNRTLNFEEGLNIIQAPNEWGKSTWCAFLVAMLYGIDTRERSKAGALPDKDRYRPWSGSPMSGTMRIDWNGRDITIQRSSSARIPMGVFSAYETHTGVKVPELTADNCGQQLLGVERSVFARSAFLRFSELPVKQDEALRSRLDSLVTTGDESDATRTLEKKLKDLKNSIRYNRTGLLPQAQAELSALENDLWQYRQLLLQTDSARRRRQELTEYRAQLENHKLALRYAAARDDRARIESARAECAGAHRKLEILQNRCSLLPSRRQAEAMLQQLGSLRRDWDSLQMEEQMLPDAPRVPPVPEAFTGLTPEEAVARARADRVQALSLDRKPSPAGLILLCAGIAALAAGAVLYVTVSPAVIGIVSALAGLIPAVSGGALVLSQKNRRSALRQQLADLIARYGSDSPDRWEADADAYAAAWNTYRQEQAAYTALRGNLDQRRDALTLRLQSTEGQGSLTDRMEQWRTTLSCWDELDDLRRTCQQFDTHLQALEALAKDAPAQPGPDTLTHSEAETAALLSNVDFELSQLQRKLGQYQGQADAIGSQEALEQKLEQVSERVIKLEQTYDALELALNTLQEARTQLQRRFAPRITRQAQDIFTRLTGGRYNRLTLGADLQMEVAALDETTLQSARFRSDGTVDQLYLALRLAVARELTPAAPLILDDALIRFDETRLKSALSLLSQEAKQRQILLFTCQDRELRLLEDCPCDADSCLS